MCLISGSQMKRRKYSLLNSSPPDDDSLKLWFETFVEEGNFENIVEKVFEP